MTGPTIGAPAEPDGAPRIVQLDVLRGVAILGILFMNISDMGGPLAMVMGGDIRTLGWTAADQVAWWLREVLANGTARCLLEMLFGAGMVILTDRAAQRVSDWEVLRRYYVRNLVLFGFGLVHVFVLLWPGDILHTYGLAALIAVWFRRLKPVMLMTIGLSLATVQLVGGADMLVGQAQLADAAALAARRDTGQTLTPPETGRLVVAAKQQAALTRSRETIAAMIVAENKARTGTARSWAESAWGSFIYLQAHLLEIDFVWEAAGTMLIGAALYRWGVLQGERSQRFYWRLSSIAYAVGLGLRVAAAYATTRFDHVARLVFATEETARVATTLGHIGAITLVLGTMLGARLLAPFVAAGRTALSLYVLQTLVTLWVLFPPFGLALYGKMGWAEMMLASLLIDAMLLMLAVWWVRRFAIAPVEWAWRSIVAGRQLRFLIARAPSRSA